MGWNEEEEKRERKRELRERDIRDQQWRQEWKRREKERQELDQVELKELESQLSTRQTQGKGGEEQERELQLARDWVKLDLDLNSELIKLLESWQRLVNQPVPFALTTAKDEQDMHKLEKMHRGLNDAMARLEEQQARDATRLEEASSNWQKLSRLADEWLSLDPTQDRLPVVEKEVKELGYQRHLLSIMLDNQSTFVAQSAYLDALLVFAGLFSAILSAFFIEIRRGPQEDLLLEILHQLQSTTSQQSFQPTPVSIWVNTLCFSSLKEAKAIFLTPEGLRRRLKEIRRFYTHAIFQHELAFLTGTASTLIYLALALFFSGLTVLFFTRL